MTRSARKSTVVKWAFRLLGSCAVLATLFWLLPRQEILSALSAVTLYRMQESARREVELGQHTKAARRLERLSTHLLSAGERKLAKAALYEAARLRKSKMLSNEGEKTLKYGTRALLLPGGKEET